MRHPEPPPVDRALRRARRTDRLMTWVITLGGLSIIAAVLGILIFMTREAWPLFQAPMVKAQATIPLEPTRHLLVEESGQALVTASKEGLRVHRGAQTERPELPPESPRLPWRSLAPLGARGELLVQGSDARVGLGRLVWDKPAGDPNPQHWKMRLEWEVVLSGGTTQPGQLLHARQTGGGSLDRGAAFRVLALQDQRLLLGEGIPGDGPLYWKAMELEPTPRAALLDSDGQSAFVGTAEGNLLLVDLDTGKVQASAPFKEGNPEGISTLGFVLGETTVVVGGEGGSLAAFQRLSEPDAGLRLQRFHTFPGLGGPVLGIRMSLRDKRFLAFTEQRVVVDHLTTEQRLLDLPAGPLQDVALSSKGDHILAIRPDVPESKTKDSGGAGLGSLLHWTLQAPHPQLSGKTLWTRIHYEGYGKPEFVWQSTGGSDDFEPKLSLVPLLVGTLKGTLYALLFALPLALIGALYTSQFASPRLKAIIKPAVELMAALPSVVLGFLAGLVLAPLFERGAVHLLLLPGCALLAGALLAPLWMATPQAWRRTWSEGREVLWAVPVLLLGLGLSLALAPWFERTVLAGDFRQWLMARHGLVYDQRNALVVGFAMGFAVIPIIFTISEDALSSVPKSLSSASLACGASPWQTAWRVILPTASPGIFSATMVGIGRAIGETMIVLMATGNTPILDWGPFNGMRTLSATLAVEAPEAPEGGTLYRVLFLTALLLFALTFLLNTVAELVRQHLRKRYETF